MMSSSPQTKKACPICLKVTKNPIELPCTHKFCYHCLEDWRPKFDIFSDHTCPVCRSAIPPTREMMVHIELLRTSINRKTSILNSSSRRTIFIPNDSTFGYILLLPKDEQQAEMRRAIKRQALTMLDDIEQFEQRYGGERRRPTRLLLDDSACFDELPVETARAVGRNDLHAIQAFLGPSSPSVVSQRRLQAKCYKLRDNTLLHFASRSGNIPLMKLLLFLGADVDAPNVDGFTPIHESLSSRANKDDTAARLLLSWGARKVHSVHYKKGVAAEGYSECLSHSAKIWGKAEISEFIDFPLGGRRCILHDGGMFAQPHLVGIAGRYDSLRECYEVALEGTGELVSVSSHSLERCDHTPESCKFTDIDKRALGPLASYIPGDRDEKGFLRNESAQEGRFEVLVKEVIDGNYSDETHSQESEYAAKATGFILSGRICCGDQKFQFMSPMDRFQRFSESSFVVNKSLTLLSSHSCWSEESYDLEGKSVEFVVSFKGRGLAIAGERCSVHVGRSKFVVRKSGIQEVFHEKKLPNQERAKIIFKMKDGVLLVSFVGSSERDENDETTVSMPPDQRYYLYMRAPPGVHDVKFHDIDIV